MPVGCDRHLRARNRPEHGRDRDHDVAAAGPSVTLGALAGPRHHPIRRTPMHYEHEALGAVWLDMGEWKRPRFYKTSESADERRCVEEEYRAVRERVGIIDVSTLGKLDVRGRDAGRLLDKVYTNRFSDLRPGRVRYSVICDEAGIMLDDGTISRLADDRYFITTTTGNLDFVQQWLEWWLAGTGWDVHVTNVTGGLAARQSRRAECTRSAGETHRLRSGHQSIPVHGVPPGPRGGRGCDSAAHRLRGRNRVGDSCPCRIRRGPVESAAGCGQRFGIRPFGVEAQRLLRLEKRHVIVGVDTDALTSPYEADMAWTVKLDKPDFIGRSALGRAVDRQPKEKLVGFIMQEDGVPEDGSAVVSGRPSCRPGNQLPVFTWQGESDRDGLDLGGKGRRRRGGHHTGARTAAARAGDAAGRSTIPRERACACREEAIKRSALYHPHRQSGARFMAYDGWDVRRLFRGRITGSSGACAIARAWPMSAGSASWT